MAFMISANMMAGRQRLPISPIAASTRSTRGSMVLQSNLVTSVCLVDEVYQVGETAAGGRRWPRREVTDDLRGVRERVGPHHASSTTGRPRAAVAEREDERRRVHG